MITISINPQSAAHIAILSKAMTELLGTTESAPAIEPAAVEPAPKKSRKAVEAPAPTLDVPATVTTTPVATAPVETAAASPSEPVKAITLEEVRAKLAALSQGGKTTEVKALLTKHGAAKLTDLKAEQYATLLEEAGAL